MKRINLKDYNLQIENPVDEEILQLLLDKLQYRYDNPKYYALSYYIKESDFHLTIHRDTNSNGKLVYIYIGFPPKDFNISDIFPIMVKVYDKEQKIRVLAEPCMNNMEPKFKSAVLRVIERCSPHYKPRKNKMKKR